MITKSGERLIKEASLEKRGNFAIGHALQNLFGRASMRFPKALGTEKIFLRNLVKPDQGMSTVGGNALFGFTKGVVPEIGIMNEQFAHMGKNLARTLEEKGIKLNELSNRDIVVLRRALRGDFLKALESNSPLANDLVSGVITSINPELKSLLDRGIVTPNMLRRKIQRKMSGVGKDTLYASIGENTADLPFTPEQAEKLLTGLGNVWKDNRLTSNLARAIDTHATESLFGSGKWVPGFLRNIKQKGLAEKLVDAQKGDDSPLRRSLRSIGDVAGNATLGVLDPGTLALNGVKRVADSKLTAKVRPGKVLQDNLQDVFVTQPMQSSFGKGMQGNYIDPLHIETAKSELANAWKNGGFWGTANKLKNYGMETIDAQVFNPFTSAAKNLANGFGKAISDAGITKEQLAAAAAKGGERYPILNKFPAEKKPLSKFLDHVSALPGQAGNALLEGLGAIPSLFKKY